MTPRIKTLLLMLGTLGLIVIAYDHIQDKTKLIIAIGVIMTIYFVLKILILRAGLAAMKAKQEETKLVMSD